MQHVYNGGLTREQFLFYEMRIVANLVNQGLTRDEIAKKIYDENLFQFPTERAINLITRCCFRRLDALESDVLIEQLATASIDVAMHITLYAMMKQNRIVWDFMITVIAEKYRTQDFSFSKKDLNLFFLRLQEQNDDIATWTDGTINKIKQVLLKTLVECEYLDSTKSENLNLIYIVPELEDEIKANNDIAALAAFNCFS